jgi:hypothetical protein
VFLLNSWLNQFTETDRNRYALSRSYSVNLPSSFSTAHPSALEYSSRLPVSVYGTGCYSLALEVFLGGLIRITSLGRSLMELSSSPSRTDLPIQNITTLLNTVFRNCVDLSLPRYPIETIAGARILTSFPSTTPFGFA